MLTQVLLIIAIRFSFAYGQSQLSSSQTLINVSGRMVALAVTPDKQFLFVGGNSTLITQWKVNGLDSDDDQIRTIPSTATGLATNGLILASVFFTRFDANGGEITMQFWNISIPALEKISNPIRNFVDAGNQPMIASQDSVFVRQGINIRQYRLSTGELTRNFSGHQGYVRSLAISEDNSVLFSGSEDSSVRQWNISTGAMVRKYEGLNQEVFAIVVNQDSVFASGNNSFILQWFINNGSLRANFSGHTEIVRSLETTNNWLFSGSADKSIIQWDIREVSIVRKLNEHNGPIRALLIINSCLYSASQDGLVKKWIIPELLPGISKTTETTATTRTSKTSATTITTIKNGSTITSRMTVTTKTSRTTWTTSTTASTSTTVTLRATSTTDSTSMAITTATSTTSRTTGTNSTAETSTRTTSSSAITKTISASSTPAIARMISTTRTNSTTSATDTTNTAEALRATSQSVITRAISTSSTTRTKTSNSEAGTTAKITTAGTLRPIDKTLMPARTEGSSIEQTKTLTNSKTASNSTGIEMEISLPTTTGIPVFNTAGLNTVLFLESLSSSAETSISSSAEIMQIFTYEKDQKTTSVTVSSSVLQSISSTSQPQMPEGGEASLFFIITMGFAAAAGVGSIVIITASLLVSRRQKRRSNHKPLIVGQTVPIVSTKDVIALDSVGYPSTRILSTLSADTSNTSITFESDEKGIYIPASYLLPPFISYSSITTIYETPGCKVLCAQIKNNQELLSRSRRGRVAIKTYLNSSPTTISQEIGIMFFFNDKPNFVKLVGFSDSPWSIMTDYYEFGSLDKFLSAPSSNNTPCSKTLLIRFALEISGAVREMHQAGFSHSDLKPQNIFVDRDDGMFGDGKLHCYLGDFGLAKILDDSHLKVKAYQVHNVKGFTIAYAAPELIQRYRRGQIMSLMLKDDYLRTDVYSLGVILYEIVVGRLVWSE